ncbi:STAS domain-containing protein [Candidatus Omnitrophota bacterium]
MDLNIGIKKRVEDIYVVKLEGRLDTDTYIAFQEKIEPILSSATKVVVLDMEKLTYISSAGLSAVFATRKALEANEGALIMTSLQPQIKKVFEIVKALPKETVFASMEEVDRYLDTIQRREIEKQDKPGT